MRGPELGARTTPHGGTIAGEFTAQGLTPLTAVAFLVSGARPTALPAVQRFSGGQLPDLTLTKDAGPESRLVNVEGNTPVWTGSVVEERFTRVLGLLTVGSISPDMNAPRDEIASAMEGQGQLAEGRTSAEWNGKAWPGKSNR